MEPLIATLVAVVATLIALPVGYFVARRRVAGAATTSEEVLEQARLEAQRTLRHAEEEARAKAETYREREDVTLEQRRIETRSMEERLAQREQTLEQRASNLAQREQMLVAREEEVTETRSEAERIREDARSGLERVAGFDARGAKEELLTQVEDEARREAMVLSATWNSKPARRQIAAPAVSSPHQSSDWPRMSFRRRPCR